MWQRLFALFQRDYSILQLILHNQGIIMSSLDTLQAQVAQSTSAMHSAVTLIQGLSAQLNAAIAAAKAGDNHAALDQLAADLANSTTDLSAAVVANTPADVGTAPTTVVDPAPQPASTDGTSTGTPAA